MAFKLTYSDGQESDHGDDTVWEIDNGVLKMGREEGKWTVLLSPSHWAVIELGGAKTDTQAEDSDSDSEDDDEADEKDSDKKDSDEKD
ncbi:MAG: hypothetical protein ABW137_05000 [Mycobacterium sp.]